MMLLMRKDLCCFCQPVSQEIRSLTRMIYGNFNAKIINKVRAGFKESNKPRASNRVNPSHFSVSEDRGRSSYHKLARVLDVTEGDEQEM